MEENQQPVEHSDNSPDLDIVDVWPTFQGEGPFVGAPALFIRLAGCNMQCPGCDTNYTTGRHRYTPTALMNELIRLNQKPAHNRLVVITGGEPFRQNLTPSVKAMLRMGFRVQVETNGSILLPDFPYNQVTVVCSPKAGINPQLHMILQYFKYVLDADHVDPKDGLPSTVLGLKCKPDRPFAGSYVYVQPADVGDPKENRRHLDAAMDSCRKHNYTLSLQQHKLIGLK